jgi:hypothetical protein
VVVLDGRPSLRTTDSGKLGVAERLPRGGGLRKFFRLSDDVDYHDGEQPPVNE